MQEPIEWVILAGIVLFLLALPMILWNCVKDLFRHEKSTGGGGGVAGMMSAIDRVVNPGGQHVQEAKEVEQEEEGIGGE